MQSEIAETEDELRNKELYDKRKELIVVETRPLSDFDFFGKSGKFSLPPSEPSSIITKPMMRSTVTKYIIGLAAIAMSLVIVLHTSLHEL